MVGQGHWKPRQNYGGGQGLLRHSYNSALSIQPPPYLVVETNSFLFGWGARCQMPGPPYRRPLVGKGAEGAYQCSRGSSSFFCNQDLFPGEGLSEYSDSDRQHDCQGKHIVNHQEGTHSPTLNSITMQLWK